MKDLTHPFFVTEIRILKNHFRSILANNLSAIISISFLFGAVLSQPCLAHPNVALSTTPLPENQLNKPRFLPTKLQNTLWWQIAKQHELDPYILYSVALIESANSGGTTKITPWPWAINKSGKSIQSDTRPQAHAILKKSIAEGNRHIDIGLMQINLHWHGNRVGKPEDLLDPVTNLKIGAGLLAEAIQSSPNDLVMGIGRYHSWENIPAAMLYGRRVLALAEQIRNVI
ncbi:transglycosylase SLT domain-containing protein [Methylomonas sp. AM2-LC]|uniref:transglycosylase SLT domain-containing protein n=1 Tax=Methylomonas sp. AM2-LC TaxID=3153301 RepID=UPI0032675E47